MVAAAVVGSAVVGAAASSSASKSAANTQANAANNATSQQTALANQALQLSQSNNQPYRVAGQSALTQLSSMLGLQLPSSYTQTPENFDSTAYYAANPDVLKGFQTDNGGMNQAQYALYHYNNFGKSEGRAFTGLPGTDTSSTTGNGATPFDISKTPGYQFQLGQGLQAVNNSGAAQSGTINSATMTGLNNYAQGQAQSYYGNYLSQLAGIAGLGQASANNSAATGANILGNLSNNVGSNIVGAGNAQAAGQVGSANAITSGLTNASGYYSLSNLLGQNGTSASANVNNMSGGDNLGEMLRSGFASGGGAG